VADSELSDGGGTGAVILYTSHNGTDETVKGKVTDQPKTDQPKDQPKTDTPEPDVPEGADMVAVTLTKQDGTTTQVTMERPRYGGEIVMTGSNPRYIDGIYGLNYWTPCKWTNEALNEGHYYQGPGGTGEVQGNWNIMGPPPANNGGGGIAESYEFPDPDSVIFHIRQGVHFHDKPPVNGREVNAYDVEFSLLRYWEAPESYHYSGVPWDRYMVSIEAIDEWTLEVKFQPGMGLTPFNMVTGASYIYPREVIDEYGDMNDWENVAGTGPFILTDLVENGSATYVRNPNYWMNDPAFPENQLPYVDGLKELYITDRSTILAAFRTGKVDQTGIRSWEDVDALLRTNPETMTNSYIAATARTIDMKQDDPSLPWYDKNVRHAMMMAINHPALKDDFYGGNAMIVAWPVAPVGDIDLFGDMYTPLEELPESTQMLYGYYPEEAKALLAEAGYPNGFKAELILMEAEADLMSIVKADMAKVGIELDLQVKEVGAYNALAYGREFTNLIQGTIDCTVEFSFWPRLGAGVPQNFGNFNDPIIEEARAEADAAGLDLFAQTRPMKRIFPHILDMAYKLTLTSPYSYIVWHPWVKNYSGTVFNLQLNTYKYWIKYAWVDQDLKN
jgi:peptide/nickel transport system substrate-binding protein